MGGGLRAGEHVGDEQVHRPHEAGREAPEHGVSVIVVSHNMEHVMEVADRAVVLRQGRYVGETEPTQENHERLVAMIVGSGEDRRAENGGGPGDEQAAVRS